MKKCPFRKADRDRIAWNGKVKGDTIRRSNRQVNGRKVWAVMPPNVFYVEDRKAMRVIFVGEGIGDGAHHKATKTQSAGRFMVLYRNLQGGEGSHRLRIRNRTDKTDSTYSTMSEALTALWRWAREKQGPELAIVEGEME